MKKKKTSLIIFFYILINIPLQESFTTSSDNTGEWVIDGAIYVRGLTWGSYTSLHKTFMQLHHAVAWQWTWNAFRTRFVADG